GTADRNRSHWSTSKTPSYTKSVSWQHHPDNEGNNENNDDSEVIIAAACGQRFGTMCLLPGLIVWLPFFS
ncbi:hypothetical protein ACUNH4_26390, partial [Serratia sp. IR-2025]